LFIEQFSQAYDGIQTKSERAPNPGGSGVVDQRQKADFAIKIESPVMVVPGVSSVSSKKRKRGLVGDPGVGSGRTALQAGPGRTRLPVGLGQSTLLAGPARMRLPVGLGQPILPTSPALAVLPLGLGQSIPPASPALAALPIGPGQSIFPADPALANLPMGILPAGLAWTALPLGPGPSTLPVGPARATLPASGAGPHSSQLAEAGLAAPALFGPPSAPEQRGSISNGNERPQKRLRLNLAEDFTDTTMPDVFRHAHPQI
jgi:hypothetical protein